MNEWGNEWMNEKTNKQTKTNETNKQINEWMNEWMDEYFFSRKSVWEEVCTKCFIFHVSVRDSQKIDGRKVHP